MGVDHPNLPMSLGDLMQKVRREAVAALQNSSIGRAGLRFYAGGRALFQGGGGIQIDDDGYIILNGNMTGEGEFDWSGNAIFRHTVNIVGPTALGATLTVTAAGKIIVGDMVIDPTSGGSVTFPNGAVVSADGLGGVQMRQGANSVFVSPGLVSMQYGARSYAISASGHQMGGLETTPSSLAGGAVPGTVWSDSSGELFRVVAG